MSAMYHDVHVSTALGSNLTNLPHMSMRFHRGWTWVITDQTRNLFILRNNNMQNTSNCLRRKICARRAVGTKVSAWLHISSYGPKAGFALCPQLC